MKASFQRKKKKTKNLPLECNVEALKGVLRGLGSEIACHLGIPGVVLALVFSMGLISSLPPLISVDIME